MGGLSLLRRKLDPPWWPLGPVLAMTPSYCSLAMARRGSSFTGAFCCCDNRAEQKHERNSGMAGEQYGDHRKPELCSDHFHHAPVGHPQAQPNPPSDHLHLPGGLQRRCRRDGRTPRSHVRCAGRQALRAESPAPSLRLGPVRLTRARSYWLLSMLSWVNSGYVAGLASLRFDRKWLSVTGMLAPP